MFQESTLRAYMDQAASDAPTPGGGSVAALCGALGSCMASMAANFTVGKKKYAEVEDEIQDILATLAPKREELIGCMEEDAIVFGAVGGAYGMPKATDEEKATRTAMIQEALKNAMAVPLKAMRAALACLELLPRLAEAGNPNLVSDTGVAAIFLEAALRAAYLNVAINLAYIKDSDLVEASRTEAKELLSRGAALCATTSGRVNEKVGA